jgi:hypothetical protein
MPTDRLSAVSIIVSTTNPDATTYWSCRLSANESAIWRRILKHSG